MRPFLNVGAHLEFSRAIAVRGHPHGDESLNIYLVHIGKGGMVALPVHTRARPPMHRQRIL